MIGRHRKKKPEVRTQNRVPQDWQFWLLGFSLLSPAATTQNSRRSANCRVRGFPDSVPRMLLNCGFVARRKPGVRPKPGPRLDIGITANCGWFQILNASPRTSIFARAG